MDFSWLEKIMTSDQGVIEIRGHVGKKWFRGYIDSKNIHRIGKEVNNFNFDACYYTLNPINEMLLNRCANRIDKTPGQISAKNDDVIYNRFLLIDCDPVRASGISATDSAKNTAELTLHRVIEDLKQCGLTPYIIADSGNGWHAHYECAKDLGHNRIELLINLISDKHSTTIVTIDRSVADPGQLCKLYGTMTRKGDNTDITPHRRSKLIEINDKSEKISISKFHELLETILAEQYSAYCENKTLEDKRIVNTTPGGREWLVSFISKYIKLNYTKPLAGGSELFSIDCPFDPTHKNEAHIVNSNSGWSFRCFHSSCSRYRWKDVRELFGYNANSERALPKLRPEFVPVITESEEEFCEELEYKEDEKATPFPIEVFPEHIRDVVRIISEETQATTELTANLVLCAYAGAASNKYKIPINDQHLNLYMAIKAPPSARKSTVFKGVFAPIFESQRDCFARFNSELTDLEKEINQRKNVNATLTKQNPIYDSNLDMIANARSQIEKRKKELPETKIVDDITVERAIKIISCSKNRIMVASAESTPLHNITRTYRANEKANIDLYLKGYDGEYYSYSRASSNSHDTITPYITIAVAGQAEHINEFVMDKMLIERGLSSRFLVVASGYLEAGIDYTKMGNYSNTNEYINYSNHLKSIADSDTNIIFNVTQTSVEQYIKYCGMLDKSFDNTTDIGLVYWIQKHHMRMIRIAGILKIMSGDISPITGDDIVRACVLAEYYRTEIHKTYSGIEDAYNDVLIQKLIRHVQKKPIKTITKSEIRRLITRSVNIETHNTFLDNIERLGLGKKKQIGRSEVYLINTSLLHNNKS